MSEIMHIRRYHFNTDTSDMLEGIGRNPNAPDPRFTHEDIHIHTGCADLVESLKNVKYEGGYAIRGDKAIVGNGRDYSHLCDYTRYAHILEMLARPSPFARWGTPSKPLTFWGRMERRWDEVKRRVVNAWAALRGDWERDDQ